MKMLYQSAYSEDTFLAAIAIIDDFIDEVRLMVFGLLSSGVAGAIGLRVGRG